MRNEHFYVTGRDDGKVLHHETCSNGCVMWCESALRIGCYDEFVAFEVWEWDAEEDVLVSVFDRAERTWDDTV